MKGNFTQTIEPYHIEEYDEAFFENQIMTVDDLAGYLKLSTKTIYRMARNGELPAKRIRKNYRFLLPDVIQWMRTGGEYGNSI